ncbi:helix-turn-helix domain-containing protein [Lactococcus lactis]|uniref:DNA methyltransferase n=1 Tax=Lactococcus lactis TaxID=1358 RepID=UPI0021A70FD8|nr:DNA methyltransferase [Lactococcus lactis]MCT3090639.1 helix-turn-helix domain-containing protein [Lactococcus lactis]MCT3137786.1 helix-turn-helix domain-containing protein [Lactococcus lactis]
MLKIEAIPVSDLIGVNDAAKILGVSANTVRRLADSGKIECRRVQSTGYRKFEKEQIELFKNKFYMNNEVTITSMNQQISLFEDTANNKKDKMQNIKAKTHPAHYMMHKYWGRKPHNVVADYISNYTNRGDVVLDPFMGSGIVPIEAVKSGRHGIGVDINPMSKFIAENTVSNVDLDEYKKVASIILDEVGEHCNALYETVCPKCGEIAHIEIAIWDKGMLARLRVKCLVDGIVIKDVEETDLEKIHEIKVLKSKLDKSGEISYPTDKVLQYVKRSGKERIDELFTDRALIILSKLRDRISLIEDIQLRKLMLFTFTSMLANVSNMLPGDIGKATYKSGWVISKFWTPKIHTERNIFHCFKLRVNAITKGKKEIDDVNSELINLNIHDSNHLDFLEDNSVDYIFTDPPYGESIAYLALSQFWNSWLLSDVDYSNEIIIDSYRNKGYEDYSKRMLGTFNEMYRVLKDKHYVSFTFHNRDLKVWKSVLDAVKKSGFVLKDITLQEQAVSSGTQGINKMNTLTGDFVYTLFKDTKHKPNLTPLISPSESEEYIKSMIETLVTDNNGITPSKLYENLIPIIVHSQTYLDEFGNAIDIEKLLEENYEYVEVTGDNRIGDKYQWIKK